MLTLWNSEEFFMFGFNGLFTRLINKISTPMLISFTVLSGISLQAQAAPRPPLGCGDRFVQGDFNGDGRADYACMYDYGTLTTPSVGEAAVLVFLGAASGDFNSQSWIYLPAGSFAASRCSGRFVAGDFSGDGKSDIACLSDDGSEQARIIVFRSSGSNFISEVWTSWAGLGNFDASRCTGRFRAGDFSGDGKTDLSCLYNTGSSSANMLVFVNSDSSFKSELWATWSSGLDVARVSTRLVTGNFDNIHTTNSSTVSNSNPTDLAFMYDSGNGQAQIKVLRKKADENKFVVSDWAEWPANSFDASHCTDRFIAGDFDGNGKTDLACMYEVNNGVIAANLLVFRSTSASFIAENWYHWDHNQYDATRCTKRLVAGDLNADGRSDIACLYDYGLMNNVSQSDVNHSRIFTYLSKDNNVFESSAMWPTMPLAPLPPSTPGLLDASQCSGFFYSPPGNEINDIIISRHLTCGVDEGYLSVGVKNFTVVDEYDVNNVFKLTINGPQRIVKDPVNLATGRLGSTPAIPVGVSSRAKAKTFVYHNTIEAGHGDVGYRTATYNASLRSYVVDDLPLADQSIVFISPWDIRSVSVDGKDAYLDSNVKFQDAFNSLKEPGVAGDLVPANKAKIQLVAFDEPYWNFNTLKLIPDQKPKLEAMADALHRLGLYVWVNFGYVEVAFMKCAPATSDPVCTANNKDLNSSKFDSISIDYYHGADAKTKESLLGPLTLGARHDWFVANVQIPYLDWLFYSRKNVAWRPKYSGQKQNMLVVPDGFVYQTWNIDEIDNVNGLFYEYDKWVKEKNAGMGSNPSITHIAPYHFGDELKNPGLGVVPFLLQHWDRFFSLQQVTPSCYRFCNNMCVPITGTSCPI
jgi:hypothetical protein